METVDQLGLYFDAHVKGLGAEVDAVCHIVPCPSLKLIFPTQVYLPISIAPFMVLLRLDLPVELLRKHLHTEVHRLVLLTLLDLPMLYEIVDRRKSLPKE